MQRRLGEWFSTQRTAVFLLTGFFLLVSCRMAEPAAVSQTLPETATATYTAVPTATTTPSPTNTPTLTPSPTPTFTPTATAVPIAVSGDPRAAVLADPERQDNAFCGIVDTLDFPLDPPEALNVSYGGEGFGRFRSRYDQYHAGEDWQLVRGGQSNFGKPVYAIGHGRVTYADPNGWGRDKGVIIIRHTFADGSTVLSFYGHMDPPSVTLRAGDCVVRGQKIAEIGDPRTPPHLHFEIRTHMPEEPGPGYWPTDPTEVGWLPPSQFVWQKRIEAQPGVVWTRPFIAEGTKNIAVLEDDTLIALEDGQLIGLSAADGSLSWRHTITETVANAMAAAGHSRLYAANRQGGVAAYPFLTTEEGLTTLADEPLWRIDLDMVSTPALLPLPGGGVIISVWQDMAAISAAGELLWEEEVGKRPYDWLLAGDQLIMTTLGNDGPIFSLTPAGVQAWPVALNGRLVTVGEQIWLYSHDGVYRLDAAALTAELLYQLPQSFLGLGSIIALPDGGALLAHRERDDSRLIALDASGAVQWQRSYDQLATGEPRLLLHDERPYLLLEKDSSIDSQLWLYAIDVQSSTLNHIFTGGTRSPIEDDSWAAAAADWLLLNVGGGSMAALDVDTAVSIVSAAAN